MRQQLMATIPTIMSNVEVPFHLSVVQEVAGVDIEMAVWGYFTSKNIIDQPPISQERMRDAQEMGCVCV